MLDSKFALQLGKVKGIPILVHWTFSLFLGFILFVSWQNNFNTSDTIWFLSFVLLLFGFVILHELGHATAARRFGVTTRDIIISPIGGIARLEELPKNPVKELIVAVAGPCVNLALALLFFIVIVPFSTDFIPESNRINLIASPMDYFRYLFLLNISLVIFNMIPAFPMDGGRVLRSLLAMKYSKLKATYIASNVAKAFAIIFLIIGIYYTHIVLALIGGFVLFMSGTEYVNVLYEHIMMDHTVRDALKSDAMTLRPYMTISDVLKYDNVVQNSYLVENSLGQSIGSLPYTFLGYAKKNRLFHRSISDIMSKNYGVVLESLSLKTAFSLMNKNGWAVVKVVSLEFRTLGVLDRIDLQEFIKVKRKEVRP